MPLLLRNIRTFTSLEASLRMLTDWLSPWRSQDHLLLVSISFRWHYLWHRSNTLKFKLCKLELEPVKKERIASRSRFTDLACCRRNAKGKIGSYRRSFNITSDNLKCFMSLLIYFKSVRINLTFIYGLCKLTERSSTQSLIGYGT